MIAIADDQLMQLQDGTFKLLHHLGIGIHRLGYKCLILAVPCYAADDLQSLSKEIYPYIARQLGYTDWHGVERAIRTVIRDAWIDRDPEIWEEYFPNAKGAPSNKAFIAVLAERLR